MHEKQQARSRSLIAHGKTQETGDDATISFCLRLPDITNRTFFPLNELGFHYSQSNNVRWSAVWKINQSDTSRQVFVDVISNSNACKKCV